jgi:hypothetical protein
VLSILMVALRKSTAPSFPTRLNDLSIPIEAPQIRYGDNRNEGKAD